MKISDNIRIAVLSNNDEIKCFLDNSTPSTLHYYDDVLRLYLKGAFATLELSVPSSHPDTMYLINGYKLALTLKEEDYIFSINKVESDERDTSVQAFGIPLELSNETLAPFSPGKAMSFIEYVKAFGFEIPFVFGINEVSDKKINYSWDGTSTVIERLFSLANVFEAELKFRTLLNDDYTLDKIVLDIYRAHSDKHQGMGENRKAETIRIGKGIDSIRRTIDTTGIFTAIRPKGKEGLTIKDYVYEEKDENGNILFFSPKGSDTIFAPQARDAFPSKSNAKTGAYIAFDWDYDTESVNTLFGQALGKLKRGSQPIFQYDVEGDLDGNLGDSFTLYDEYFNPPLLLEARIEELEISLSQGMVLKTTYGNFVELKSGIDDSLIAQMKSLIGEIKNIVPMVVSDAGLQMFGTPINNTLKATLYDKGVDIDPKGTKYTYAWTITFLDAKGAILKTEEKYGRTIEVLSNEWPSKARTMNYELEYWEVK